MNKLNFPSFKITVPAVAAAGLLMLSGCTNFFSVNYKVSREYDFGLPAPAKELQTCRVEIRPFHTSGALRTRMKYRMDGNRLEADEYNRWSQLPGTLLSQYLSAYFSKSDANKKLPQATIFGTVLNCEEDLDRQEVILMVKIQINELNITKTEVFRQPVKSDSAKVFADAVSACAAKLAQSLYNDLSAAKQGSAAK